MRLAVDGVCFQRAGTGVARLWTSLLRRLAKRGDVGVVLFDRGGAPSIPGVELRPFPSYTATYTAADSLLLQELCAHVGADVFTSTGFTSALTTPQVQLIHDTTPEVMGFDTSARSSKEKRLTLRYAGHFACTSIDTREKLLRLCPGFPPERAVVTHCGVDAAVFNASASAGLDPWRDRNGIGRDYVLLFGGRGRDGAESFRDAVKLDPAARFDIVCIGGEGGPNWSRDLPRGVRAVRLDPSEADLATAYSGAIASVHLSRHEGFALPLVEAMASGCPIIATRHGSLTEVVGAAAHFVSDHDPRELLRALRRVQIAAVRRGMAAAGFARAKAFDWDTMAHRFHGLLRAAAAERGDASVIAFHRRWKELRTAQADVDTGLD